jgi:hypothetical protein
VALLLFGRVVKKWREGGEKKKSFGSTQEDADILFYLCFGRSVRSFIRSFGRRIATNNVNDTPGHFLSHLGHQQSSNLSLKGGGSVVFLVVDVLSNSSSSSRC